MKVEMYCEFCNKLMGELYLSTEYGEGNVLRVREQLAWNCVGCYTGVEE